MIYGILEVVQHESAIYVTRGHLRITFQGQREIFQCSLQISVVSMNVSGNQRQILIVLENGFVLRHQRQSFIQTPEIIQIVSEIDHALAVIGEFRKHILPELGGLRIILP